MEVTNLSVPDYHDLNNALSGGPSVPGVVSFKIEWSASHDKARIGSTADGFVMNGVFNKATAQWSGTTALARFVSDPNAPTTSLFAEVGHERNGVFLR